MFGDRHDETELLIDLIEGALSEEGYCANRYSGDQTSEQLHMTQYT